MTLQYARQMPEARSRLLRWLSGRHHSDLPGVLAPEQAYAASRTVPNFVLALPRDQRGPAMSQWVTTRVRLADLHWVSDDLTDLAEHAGTQIPEHRLHPEELPHDIGLLAWARPIVGADGREIIATLWVALPEGVWIATWVDPMLSSRKVLTGNSTADPAAVERRAAEIGSAYGWLAPDEEFLLPWTTAWQWDSVEGGRARAISTLIATWLLMGQTLTVSEQIQAQPSERRRLQRRGDPEPVVTYVALRKQRTQHEPHDDASLTPREYHHRWLVSGHWRKQWYASVETHRPIWISPHIKGPAGAPLLRSEHVYTLRR